MGVRWNDAKVNLGVIHPLSIVIDFELLLLLLVQQHQLAQLLQV